MAQMTIDELLEWFETFYGADDSEHDPPEYKAIRAIIEDHRDCDIIQRIASIEIEKECERQKREAVRAYVERVYQRFNDGEDGSLMGLLNAMAITLKETE